jgi:hypothetical protein
MTLRKKKNPRASQHYMGWRDRQKSLLLPVAGEFFLLTLPFIERAYRKSEALLQIFGNPTTQELADRNLPEADFWKVSGIPLVRLKLHCEVTATVKLAFQKQK